MRILLLRHGKPEIPDTKRISVNDISIWMNSYDLAGVRKDHQPSDVTISIVSTCNVIVCSTLNRSIDSANFLCIKEIHYIDPIFREMELPYLPYTNWPSPKLPPLVWVAFFRALWFCGYSSNSESFFDARDRAISCANKLVELAKNHDSVLFVGHGFLNHFIAKELLSLGWQGPSNPGKKYWNYAIYELKET